MNIETLYEMNTEEKYEYVNKLADEQKIELIINFIMITKPLIDEDFEDRL